MIAKSKEDQKQICPLVFLAEQTLHVLNKVRYLGQIIRNDLGDDDDVQHKCYKLHA